MAQQMEVDFDVPKFLYETRQNVPSPLQHYFSTFEDYYERKLWHQLTLLILELFKEPGSDPFKIPVFQKFVAEWEDKINKLSLVTIAQQAATQFSDPNDSVEFLKEILKKVDTSETRDAYVLASMESAHYLLKIKEIKLVKKTIDESEMILDTFDSVDTSIHASFYRVSAEYYKGQADYAQYYKNALLYLSCIDISELTVIERIERAYDLSLSALLGETIYNFGELLMHPILDSLFGTEHDWLRSLLFAFNAGDIGKFEALAPHFTKQPLFEQSKAALRRKICLISLIEAVFIRSTDNRSIPFSEIAAETRLSMDEVEHLVMKALSLKLIRGSIDQVDQIAVVTWVQPRVLDKDQIDGMRRKLEEWDNQVKRISSFVGEQATILYQINVIHTVTFAEQQDDNSYTHKLLDSNKQRKGIEKAATVAVPIILRTWDEAYEMATTFVQQMSLQQKVNITTGIGWETGPCVGNSGRTTNPNFPELCLQDSPLGVRFADGVSSGVAGINAAASFDKEAIRRRGEYMGAEFRAKGIHAQLGPSMNMMRCPTSGRNWEAFGEDPYLVGVASVETINGIQSQGVHSVHIDERTINEIYLWPFARAVEADVASVMCSYNKLNGIYTCESDYVINKLLKESLGFRGFVQSDWSATHSTADSANHGLDMTMPGDITFHSNDSYFGTNLTNAVSSGLVNESRVTDMATRIVAAWYKLGQDQNFPDVNFDSFRPSKDKHLNVQNDHRIAIRHMGAASTVLLKNKDNILPLREPSIRKIAVIGSDAGPNIGGLNCADHGCNNGSLAQGWGSGTANYPYLITPGEGIRNRVGNNIDVIEYLKDDNYEAATKVAADADIAIVFVNANSGEEFITVEGNKGDRNHLHLWNNGDSLIHAIAGSNKNTIVVAHSVGPVLMPWANHPNVKAILWPGLPGQESGNSIADVLFGDLNPSARLPYTIAKKAEHYPAKVSRELEFTYAEGMYIGYRWFDKRNIEPQYEFGYGLSYTTFNYTNFKTENIIGDTKDPEKLEVTVQVNIKNTGRFDGAEIPQLYVSFPEIAQEPPKILRGFEKVFLSVGQESQISFKLKKTDLSYYNIKSHGWVVPKGDFKAHIGSSSRNIKGTIKFTLF
ncbi:hypothetical protein G6F62_005205 [Rhizopus arrhizus]|nr:hypothetical protein G6F62_005205 [Rhizopus arrhizus]